MLRRTPISSEGWRLSGRSRVFMVNLAADNTKCNGPMWSLVYRDEHKREKKLGKVLYIKPNNYYY